MDIVSFVRGELEHSSRAVRLKAVKNICTCAKAAGPSATRTSLVPLLLQHADDEDEVLFCLAKQLAELPPLLGGVEFATILIDPLERMASVEETVVRNQAVESLIHVLGSVDVGNQDAAKRVMDVLKGLAEGDWFTSRVSACALHAKVYAKFKGKSDECETIRTSFATLAKDDAPMVRRAAAREARHLARVLDPEYVLSDVAPVLDNLSSDEHDSVRVIAIESLAQAVKVVQESSSPPPSSLQTLVRNIVTRVVDDSSWRVRNAIAKEFPALVSALSEVESMFLLFCKLFEDAEAEVRASACKSLPGFCDMCHATDTLGLFTEHMLPILRSKALTSDQTLTVRLALVQSIMEIMPKLKDQPQVVTGLFEHITENFIVDEGQEVVLEVLKRIPMIAPIVPDEDLKRLKEPLVNLSTHPTNWRIRCQVILSMSAVASKLGVKYLEAELLKSLLAAFSDRVYKVREAVTAQVPNLLKLADDKWVISKILTPLADPYASCNYYLHRITVLKAMEHACANSVSTVTDALAGFVSEFITSACEDPVANVRLVAAASLGKIPQCLDDEKSAIVKKTLAKLKATDSDEDVKYAATMALENYE